MAKKRARSAAASSPLDTRCELKELDHSRFMVRLSESPFRDRVTNFAKYAADLLNTTSRYMPLYTLHNERHILNVLSWMEWLASDVIDHLSPIECALCVMAAYAHDLGMTLTTEEHAEILGSSDSGERRKYRDFIDGFVDEKYEIERLKSSSCAQDQYTGQLLEQHLLTEYLRRTHADKHAERMRTRLDTLLCNDSHISLFKIKDQNDPFRAWLDLIAISHNQDVGWLRCKLQSTGFDTTAHGQNVNAVYISLLLRLADIMDFDSSRTPTILFHHIGLDREFGGRFSSSEKLSQQEWRKHMAISDIAIQSNDSGWKLTYVANACDHPAVDKSIREFVEWIRREVSGCRNELNALKQYSKYQNDRYSLRLPDVEHAVTPARTKEGQAVYQFEDWHFRLDQQEIIRLLMGESLYGDPSLCIRELLQNSLDALEVRDLRLQVPKDERREPVDGIPVKGKPGCFLDADGNEQPLQVRLTWGRGIRDDGTDAKDGPWWIQVEDNGVGMTPAVIEKFFTQLGRSYYRSAEFESEKADLRRHGLLATPISQFGIGVLSCFMIADRLEVRTCPANADHTVPQSAHRSTDLTISGPGSLFWTKPGTRKIQGTEIRLILRRERNGAPISLEHDSNRALRYLRRRFHYSGSEAADEKYPSNDSVMDPAAIAALHVVWPKYPVVAATSPGRSCDPHWSIDDQFHAQILNPLNVGQLLAKGREWSIQTEAFGAPQWTHFDWTDTVNQHIESATGSRIRIWFARPDKPKAGSSVFDDSDGRLPLTLLAGFVEAIERNEPKHLVFVKSMHVRSINLQDLQISGGVGCRVWLDLRGSVEFRLTADRTKAIEPDTADRWKQAVGELWRRFKEFLLRDLDGNTSRTRNVLSMLSMSEYLSAEAANLCSVTREPNMHAQNNSMDPSVMNLFCNAIQLTSRLFFQAISVQRKLLSHHWLIRDNGLALNPMNCLPKNSQIPHETVNSRASTRFRIIADAEARAVAAHSTRLKAQGIAPRLNSILDANIDHTIALAIPLDLFRTSELRQDVDTSLLKRFGFEVDTTEASGLDGEVYSYLTKTHESYSHLWAASTMQQAFWPSLQKSWPTLELFTFRGQIGNALLTAPAAWYLQLGPDQRTVEFADANGKEPDWIVDLEYDLCWPMPSIPIGRLRRDCPGWREDRRYQVLGTMPMIFPSQFELWPKYAPELNQWFQVPRIYSLVPPQDLWMKPFTEWTDDDKCRSDHLSILWNISTGEVHYAAGIQRPEETVAKGQPYGSLIQEFDRGI